MAKSKNIELMGQEVLKIRELTVSIHSQNQAFKEQERIWQALERYKGRRGEEWATALEGFYGVRTTGERNLLDAGQRIRDSLKDINRQVQDQIGNLAYLRDAGVITWQEYADAVGMAANQLPNLASKGEDAMKRLQDSAMGFGRTMADVFMDIFAHGDSAFRALGLSMARNLLGNLYGKAFAGLGAAFPSLGSFFSLFAHSGAMVGGYGGAYRDVPAMAFAGAPRYHSGGFPGLATDEIPIIARKGEGIFTPKQMDTIGGVSITQNITIDARGADATVEAKIRLGMKRAKEETMSEVLKSFRRGGPLAVASK